MHRYSVSESVKERVLRRQGKPVAIDVIDAARATRCVVVYSRTG